MTEQIRIKTELYDIRIKLKTKNENNIYILDYENIDNSNNFNIVRFVTIPFKYYQLVVHADIMEFKFFMENNSYLLVLPSFNDANILNLMTFFKNNIL
jgi:hypothetical protein